MAQTEADFAELGVSGPIVAALAAAGITHPFPIQSLTLPVALSGADIIGQAKTGTGKTLGFGIPLLQRVVGRDEAESDSEVRLPQALVVVPTRELAKQVAADLVTASTQRTIDIITIYGGKDFEPQIQALKTGVDVVVGTPGRLLDLYGRKVLKLHKVNTVVLDEADEMLDLGFLPDVERIINAVPAQRQTMLFSATMPGAVITLARRYMNRPTHIRAHDHDDLSQTGKNTTQFVYRAHSMDKDELVARLLQAEGRGRTIIFTRTKRTADKLAAELTDRGFAVRALHGDLGQVQRERALKSFHDGHIDVLVATDVAARGIDIDDVTHVVNFQCPDDEKTYVHRIGRTGRAGKSGVAVTLVDWDDLHRWRLINKALGLDHDDPAETYSTSPHFFSDLGIPKGTKGRLPRQQSEPSGEDASGERKRERRRGGASQERGRGSRDRGGQSAADESGEDAAQKRTRRTRERRRTRGGKPVGRASRAHTDKSPAGESAPKSGESASPSK
ncbi:superfamily II DNA/RNA helicase [Brevibacterium sanguinis]|uniref:RNA helicase n=2 Tax=Brevibacterium TaxID=1696 RepID=A0A366IN01_9MICO|nr:MULTISPECIES: DEAD/DEAH box helicase [Brevibacterium]RBP66304.1 superfamily II DNA/RNA helicase [Brevibacterium sanguinis]RBP72955.1 superfamily II DNA/RNA helicase [Brevibacterium celere]